MECLGNSTSCTPWTRDSSGAWQVSESPRLSDARVSQTQPTWHKTRHTHRRTQRSRRREYQPPSSTDIRTLASKYPLSAVSRWDCSDHLLRQCRMVDVVHVLIVITIPRFCVLNLLLLFFRHLHCCRWRRRKFSKARRLSISHGNLNYWTWCSGNSWSSRNWLPLHCRCRLNRACLLVSIHTSNSSPARLCLQKMKRHDSRTPSSELIKYLFHQQMKWNEMNCTVSNYKWNEMKWNVTDFSSRRREMKFMKYIFFMKFHEISWDKKGSPNEMQSLSILLEYPPRNHHMLSRSVSGLDSPCQSTLRLHMWWCLSRSPCFSV